MNSSEKISSHEVAEEGNQPSEWDSLKDLEFDAGRAEAAREESRKAAVAGGEEISQGPEAEDIASDLRSEILEEGPMTPEEKERLLDFDALAEISTEEYLQLWRRLNPFFMTHVTRQGIRDHNGMVYHSAGMSDFHNGLTSILSDGKVLKSPATVHGLDQEVSEDGVRAFIEDTYFSDPNLVPPESRAAEGFGDAKTITEIVDGLSVNSGIAAADHWADRRAIHLAQHIVLDSHYGGERGNEAFFVFPSDVIASQALFGGHMNGSLTTANVTTEQKWNDAFIWPEDGEIPVDAGIAFLPRSTKVDPKTGSKYELVRNEAGELATQQDPAIADKFVELAKSMPKLHEMYYGDAVKFLAEKFDELSVPEGARADLESGLFQFSEYGQVFNLYPEDRAGKTEDELPELSVRKLVSSLRLDLKLAENPVSAEEYWEGYFREHPEERPAHIIYYDGDPTKAVQGILRQAGVFEEVESWRSLTDQDQRMTGPGDTAERDGKLLGFDGHYAEEGDPRIQEGHERFNQLARKVIAERFGLVDKHGRIDGVDEDW